MTAAIERGDLDEAARQGALAGPGVVEQALRSNVRETVLAGIVAAPGERGSRRAPGRPREGRRWR